MAFFTRQNLTVPEIPTESNSIEELAFESNNATTIKYGLTATLSSSSSSEETPNISSSNSNLNINNNNNNSNDKETQQGIESYEVDRIRGVEVWIGVKLVSSFLN